MKLKIKIKYKWRIYVHNFNHYSRTRTEQKEFMASDNYSGCISHTDRVRMAFLLQIKPRSTPATKKALN